MKWKVVKLPFLAQENDFYGREQDQILWENHFSPEEIEEIKSDPATFQALFQQEPQPHEGSWFGSEWVQEYDSTSSDPTILNRYILVDPALSRKSTSNYTAMVVVGLGEDRKFYVLSFYRDRVDPHERADALFRLVRKWKPIKVGYEQYGLVADVAYLKERMDRVNFHFTLQELGKVGPHQGLSKKDRIRQLIPLFREGRIWLPKVQMFEDSNGNEVDLVKVFKEQEYLRYPSSTYDDMLDVLARITDPQMAYEWPEPEDSYIETQPSSGGGSWVSG